MEAHRAVLMVISDAVARGVAATLDMANRVCASARPGSVLVQLRDRELPDRERLRLGEDLRGITRRHQQWLSVNDRLDMAFLLEADAVHLPEQGPDVARVRSYCERRGRQLWLSVASHFATPLQKAADGFVLAPVASERKGRSALGFDALARVMAEVGSTHRVFALGGIDANNAANCTVLGAGVATIGAAYSIPEQLVHVLAIERSSPDHDVGT